MPRFEQQHTISSSSNIGGEGKKKKNEEEDDAEEEESKWKDAQPLEALTWKKEKEKRKKRRTKTEDNEEREEGYEEKITQGHETKFQQLEGRKCISKTKNWK